MPNVSRRYSVARHAYWLPQAALTFVALTGPCREASADIFELATGGEIHGMLVENRKDGLFVVHTPDGATVAVNRRDVSRHIEDNPLLAVYRDRARTTPDTAKAHGELAKWCEENRLVDQRDHHYQCVLRLDPEDETARTGLGYRRVGGQWLTREELLESRGLRLFKGRYRTSQAIALLERKNERERNDSEWLSSLRTWVLWMQNRARRDRMAEGQARIAAIDDPSAAPSLVRLMRREDDPWIYEQLLATLGRLNHPAVVDMLIEVSLYSEESDFARDALGYLMDLDIPRSIVPFVGALRSKDNIIVNRAAEALGKFDDKEAISPLIDALQTTHRLERDEGAQLNAAFDGAGGGGFSFGNKPKYVDVTMKNVQVLNSLSKLSGGQDFGYDERAWRNWYVNEQARQRIDSRRDM